MIKNVSILQTEILSSNWYTLKKITYEYQKKDGSKLVQTREAYDRGNGATILLYKDNPEECIRRETEEETGYKITDVRKVYEAYMSPGSVTEILYFFVAAYTASMKVSEGGGIEAEQENIEVLEILFDNAMQMVQTGA